MNRIARTLTNLTIATGMATAALSIGSVAHAEIQPGPVIVLPPADPGPQNPDDIATPEPGPVDPTDGPDDIKAPAPKPHPPKGPKDLSNGDSDPVVDPKPEQPTETKPAPEDKTDAPKKADVVTEVPATEVPVLNDTLTETADAPVAEASTVATQHDGDSDYLLWLLAGLGAAGATGLVVIAARRRKAADEA
jgi:hypothetical protein